MIVIRGVKTLPRLVGAALSERMRVMPAVVVTGARQTGKSTLVEHLLPGKRRYATLDDLDVLDAARRDPEVLVGVPGEESYGIIAVFKDFYGNLWDLIEPLSSGEALAEPLDRR